MMKTCKTLQNNHLQSARFGHLTWTAALTRQHFEGPYHSLRKGERSAAGSAVAPVTDSGPVGTR